MATLLLLSMGCGRLGFDPRCEVGEPCVLAAVVNGGSAAASGPDLSITVTAEGAYLPLEVRISEARSDGDCQAQFADDRWESYLGARTTYRRLVEPVDGVKKLCAWAKDARGHVSAISPAQGLRGIDVDTIELLARNPPIVEGFAVAHAVNGGRTYAAGDPMRVSWTVSDVEQLAAAPIDLEYTLDPVELGNWLPLAEGIGGPLDDPRHATGSFEVPAPSDQPFLVRLVPRDAADNRGYAAISDPQNVTQWSVYAGTRDRGVGGAAHTASLYTAYDHTQQFTVDPTTHDVYALDDLTGIVKLDAQTGQVELLIGRGPANLPDDGPLPVSPTLPLSASVQFGPDGRLYVAELPNYDLTRSGVIYQIDPVTRHCRKYLGGGTGNDATATPSTVFVFPHLFHFDDDGALYFMTSCTPGSWIEPSPVRMLKATRGPGGAAQTISVVAGACAGGVPPGPGPLDPLTVRIQIPYPGLGSIAAWDHGRVIYFGFVAFGTWKIVDGQLYATSVTTASTAVVAYDATRGTLYAADDQIVEYQPNRAGPNGETIVRTVVTSTALGRCTDDGVAADQACANAEITMQATPERLYFADGPGLNEARTYRVRFVDSAGTVQTYLGRPQFHGEGLDRHLVRSAFGGIHYKRGTDPNQAAFPEGLYFVDPQAVVFGHVEPSGRVRIDGGNQNSTSVEYPTGAAIGPDASLGISYLGGNMRPLAFDQNGLPWLRYGPDVNRSLLISLDASRRIVERQSGAQRWETAADGTDPALLDSMPYGAVANLTLDGDRTYLLGGYTGYTSTVTLKLLDFGAQTSTRLMGAAGNAFTPDRLTPGTVGTASISAACFGDYLRCFVVYRPDQDRLYFSEGNRIRYITQPKNAGASTLVTLYVHGAEINNFSFRPDGTQVFYISGGELYCHDLSSGRPWCNDTVLGPPPILSTIANYTNQLTWRDDQTLLIGTRKEQILEYVLPP